MRDPRLRQQPNLFQNTARFYDLDLSWYPHHDVEFYLQLAAETGGPILELACGTGRVTIPLARAGYEVYGFDLSRHMLSILQAKINRLPMEISRRIHLHRDDMRNFDVRRRFPLVIAPFRSFQALTDEEDITGALGSIRRHLAPGARAVVDLFAVGEEPDSSWLGEQVDWVRRMPETGEVVTRTRKGVKVDHSEQVIYSTVSFHVQHADGETEAVSDRFALKYYFPYQMQVRLAAAGFSILDEYGYYDRRRIETGPELIYVFQ
jgi:SAM-dependent methyltransferase